MMYLNKSCLNIINMYVRKLVFENNGRELIKSGGEI